MGEITNIPDYDYAFSLGDLIEGRNYLGLRYTGGIYTMFQLDTEPREMVYVGISNEVGRRLKNHVNVYKKTTGYGTNLNPNLVYKLMSKFNFTRKEAQDYLKSLTVGVILEEDKFKRREIEKFIIENYWPKYNLVR